MTYRERAFPVILTRPVIRSLLKGSDMDSTTLSVLVTDLRNTLMERRKALRAVDALADCDALAVASCNAIIRAAVADLRATDPGIRCGWGGRSENGQRWADALLGKLGSTSEKRAVRAAGRDDDTELTDSIPTD